MIVIVDYGTGNLASIKNMFDYLDVPSEIRSDAQGIGAADKLVLPGVGSFGQGMDNLHKSGLLAVLNRKVLEEKTPVLGICLGMQLMTRRSEEGGEAGLGWIPADTVHFSAEEQYKSFKIPHMGWNVIAPAREHPLLANLPAEPRFYFVHSYHVVCDMQEDVLATARYSYAFTAMFARGNIAGAQFHPEKSHKYGMRLLKNFAEVFK